MSDARESRLSCTQYAPCACRWGNSPLKNALDAGHKEVAEMLKTAGAKDFSNDTEGFELNKAAALGELHKVRRAP